MGRVSKALFAAAGVAGAVVLASAQETCEAEQLTFSFGGIPGCGPSDTLNFGSCCGNLVPEEGGNTGSGNGGSGNNGELSEEEAGLCRTMTVSAPFCENPNLPTGCDGFEPTSIYVAEFFLTFVYPDPEIECCLTCKCYGDPLCEAFDGSTDEFIECDGRNDTTCEMSRDVCKQQRDHTGRRCDWLKNNDKYPDYVNNLVSGSPCQADYESVGNLEILMYDADGFSVSTTIGERGVIIGAEVGMPDLGVFAITYESCAAYDPRNVGNPEAAWTLPPGVTELPANWEVSTPNSVDIVWSVGSVENGVFVDIICTRATGAERGRLDVKNLIETQLNRDGEGYCFTGVINRGEQSGSNVNRRGFHFMCLNMLLPSNIDTCKRLIDGACSEADIEDNREKWCEQAELSKTMAEGETRPEQVASCIEDLGTGNANQQAQTWITYACQMNTPNGITPGTDAQESYVMECVQVVSQFGWEEWLDEYQPLIPYSETPEDNCASSLSDYGTIDDDTECANGVMVQVFKEGTWQQVLYIPADFPPCDDAILEADGGEYPDLFRYQVRLRQCGLGAECLANEDGTNCKQLPEVEASIEFTGISCERGGGNCTDCIRDLNELPPQVCESTATEPYRVGNCDQCCETLNFLPGQEEQNCRELTVDVPYCDEDENSAQCEELRRTRANGELEITITATAEDFNELCCETCQLWGDPFGEAFDGSREKLIICDSRDTTCFSNKDLCLTLKDHAGNTCTYNDTTAASIVKRGDIGAYGSPCLPDWELSGEAEVVMYETQGDFPTFKVVFYTGERSILTSMNVTTPLGLYNLDPTECYNEDMDFPGWTVLEGAPLDEAFNLQYFQGGEAGYGAEERAWAVTDLETGIFMKITCVFSRAVTSNKVGNYRLNIQKLIDLDQDRAAAADGYCPTADLQQYGGEYTPNTNAEACEDDLANDHLAAKAFWAGSATPSQIQLAVTQWCGFANIDITIDECVSQIYRGPNRKSQTANRWLAAVCKALIPARDPGQTPAQHEQFCVSLGNTDGYFSVVERYGSAGSRAAVQSFCTSNVNDYGVEADSDPCLTGIRVEYQNEQGNWVEVFYMPADNLPCNGKLTVPANSNKYFPLFTRPIRFVQCDINPQTCPASSNIEPACMSAFGYELVLQYSNDDLGCPDGA